MTTTLPQQVLVIEGAMEMAIGDKGWRLEIGDCLTMRLMPTGEFFGTTFYCKQI